MTNEESIKKEIDTSGNEILEIHEMEEFLKSDENIKKLGEDMSLDPSSELVQQMESVLKTVCESLLKLDELTANQEQTLNYFLKNFGDKYPEIKAQLGGLCEKILNKQNVNDISLNQYKILLFYFKCCGKENQNEKVYRKVGIFLNKLYDNYKKQSERYMNGKGEKQSGAVAQFLEELQQEEIYKINELAEKITKEMEEEMNPISQQSKKEKERLDNLLIRWKKDKIEVESLLQKDGNLSEEEKQKLLYFRDFYYNEGHISYKNNYINDELGNKLTDELGGKGLTFGIVGYDEIANQIDKKLNSGLFNSIDNVISKGELPKDKDCKGLKNINEWIVKFGRNNPEKYEKLEKVISKEITNIVGKTFKNEDRDNLTLPQQIGTIQLWANLKYGENLQIDGVRGKRPFGNGENQKITNLSIYKLQLSSRESKQYSNILKIPNIDGILRGTGSKDIEHKVFEEFLVFFLKIRQPGISFENKIGSENLQKVLLFLIDAEKYKGVTVDDYIKAYSGESLTEEEKIYIETLKKELGQYQNVGQYYREISNKLINLYLKESERQVEIYREQQFQSKIQQFDKTFNEINKGDISKRGKLKILGKEILKNPRLLSEQRREIIVMLGGVFSEIETSWDEIKVGKGFQRICRGGRFSNLAPISIKFTQGCDVSVAYLHTVTDVDRIFPEGQEPLDLVIYLDGKPLKVGGPLNKGRKFERDGYDISIDANKNLIIKKIGGDGSELKSVFGDKIYNEYQTVQKQLNDKLRKNEEYSDISSQVESSDGVVMLKVTEEEKNLINDETGYTKELAKYKSAYQLYMRQVRTNYSAPTPPKTPKYEEYHHLNIPGCEGKIVHIKPSEWNKIKTAIKKNGRSMCFNPVNQQSGNIYELTLKDLNISKKDKGGNIHLYEINTDGSQGNEIKNISAKTLNEVRRTSDLVMTSVQMAPGLKNALDKASTLSKDLEYIGKEYSKFENAKLTDEGAENIMKKAGSIMEYLNELCKHHNDFVQLKKGLEQWYSGNSSVNTESEQTIKGTISNLEYLINATETSGEIQKYCASFLNERKVHSNDTVGERIGWWIKNNGIKTVLAIAGGVAAVCFVPVSGGSLALLQMAAVMTAGGMAGGFVGQIANEALWNSFTKPIEIETKDGKKKIEIRYDDPTSLEMAIKGDISRKDFALETGIQFITGTATTFGCMYAGNLIGGWITKACESGKISPKFQIFLEKFNKNFKVENGDPMTDGLFKEMANKIGQNKTSLIKNFNTRFFDEFKDELKEEFSETGFEEISNGLRQRNPGLALICSGLATLATAWHCITPGGNMSKIYTENGISIGDIDCPIGKKTLEITLDYSGDYDAIVEYYHKNGFDPVNGHLEMMNPDNSAITNIIHLRKTDVPMATRSLAGQLSGYGITLDSQTGKGYYENISDMQKLELSGKANVSIDPKTKKVTITSGETTLVLEQSITQINSLEHTSPLVGKIDNSVFERVINSQELKKIALQEIENGTLEIGENGEILNVYIEVNGEKKPSKLFQSLTNGGLSSEQALKSRLQTRTTEFKERFGDWQNNPENASKIVDENGEPLVMWHGTSREFNEFSHDAHRNYDWVGNTKDWFYFSNNNKFTHEQYANTNQKSFEDITEKFREATNMDDYDGENRISEFETRWNKIIEGFNNGETEFKDTGHGFSDLFYKGKSLYIGESLGRLFEGKEHIGKNDFELREMPIKFNTEDGPIQFTMKIYVPNTNYNPINLPFFVKGNNISQVNGEMDNHLWMDNSFDKAIKQGDNNTDIIKALDTNNGNQFIGVRDATQIKSAVNNDGSFSPNSGKFNDYFGKKPKLAKNMDSQKAYNNSEKMDNYLSQIKENGENLGIILTELREEINKEYKKATNTDEDLDLTDEQLLSVLDAHEQDGVIGELTIGQLKQKVKTLAETITDPNVRRFLLEAGFCGKMENEGRTEKATKDYNNAMETLGSDGGLTELEKTKYDTKKQQYQKIKEYCTKTDFMSEHDLYKIFNERISVCKSKGDIEEFLVKRNATLEYFSGNEVRFRDPKTKEIVEGKNIFDYGKSLFGDKFQTPECQKLRKVMEEFMFNQSLDNPLQYNSHGFDHSILVDAYSQMVIDKESIRVVSEKYGISSEGAEVLLRLSAVFHDFGYPEIVKVDEKGNVTLKMDKSMHGLEGGLLFENEIAPAFRDVMKLYGVDGAKLDQAVIDMRDAISFHSADKIEEPPYKFKLHTEKGEILINDNLDDACAKWLKDSYCRDGDIVTIHAQDGVFNENSQSFKNLKSKLESQGIKVAEKCEIDEPTNRYTTSVEVDGQTNQYYRGRKGHDAKGRPIGIEIQPIDLYESPLAGVVRFADNMDMAFNRLSEVQKNPVFMDMMYNLGMDAVWDGKGTPPASRIFQEMEGIKSAAKKLSEGKITPDEFKSRVDEFLNKYGEITTLELFTYDAKTGTRNPNLSGTMEFNPEWKADIEGLKSKEVSNLEEEALNILNKFKESLVTELNDLEYPEGGPRGKNPYFNVIKGVSIEKKTGSYSLRHVAGLTCIEDVRIDNGSFVVTLDPKVYYDSALSRQTVTEKGDPINVNDYHIWRLFDASSKVTIDGQVSNVMMTDAHGNLMGVITRCSENGKFKPYYALMDGNGNIVKNAQGKAIFVDKFSDAQTYYQLSTIETSAYITQKDRQDMLNSIIKDGKTFVELQEIYKDIKGLKEGDNIDNYKDDSWILRTEDY